MILIPRNLLALIVLEDLAAAPNASTLKSFKAPIFNTAHPSTSPLGDGETEAKP